MRHGLSLFPVLAPEERSAAQWFAESLVLAELAEGLGLNHVQIDEHHLGPYGGYSPDPATFLAAAATRTTRLRLIVGAAIPGFTHPLQLAGKLAMLDNLSYGRVGVAFGGAVLLPEFAPLGLDLEPGGQRYLADVETCRRLWSEREVTIDDGFHRFGPVTSLPRTVQRPHPPICVASATTWQTCAWAGAQGFGLQMVPADVAPAGLVEMVAAYRKAWSDSGRHPAEAEIQLKLTCYLDTNRDRALGAAETLERNRIEKMPHAAVGQADRRTEAHSVREPLDVDVAHYDFAASHRADEVLAGSPADVVEQLERIRERLGEVDVSCVFNPGYLSAERAEAALRIYATQVVPALECAPVQT